MHIAQFGEISDILVISRISRLFASQATLACFHYIQYCVRQIDLYRNVISPIFSFHFHCIILTLSPNHDYTNSADNNPDRIILYVFSKFESSSGSVATSAGH